jgi:hypothetical protein
VVDDAGGPDEPMDSRDDDDPEGPAVPATYRVRAGDTLYVIARRHGTSVAELVRSNAIANRHVIHAGQALTVRPGTGAWVSRTMAGRLLASYFQGPNAVARWGVSAAGNRYADQVLGHRQRFR